MVRIIMAEVHLKDLCDPAVPGDCAPVVYVAEAAEEIEELTSYHGIGFDELLEEEGTAELVALEEVEEPQEVEGALICCLEPDRAWDDSACALVLGSEVEVKLKLAELDLLIETKKLLDEGGS